MSKIPFRMILLSVLSLPHFLFPKPTEGIVKGGKALISSKDQTLLIEQSSERACIDWDSFSISSNETVQFLQPSPTSAVLNRVASRAQTLIEGTLLANGIVYLINSEGIVFGPNASIQTGGFLASTFHPDEADFLENKPLLFQGGSVGTIVQSGSIFTESGDLFLLAHRIVNEGKLEAPQGEVHLASAKEILFTPSREKKIWIRPDLSFESPEDQEALIQHKGTIEALSIRLSASGSGYREAIRSEGTLEARSLVKREGGIFLTADQGLCAVSGSVLAKNGEGKGAPIHIFAEAIDIEEADLSSEGAFGGGEILIGGDFQGNNREVGNALYTRISSKTALRSNALLEGDGGKVIVWADEFCGFYGTVESRGGIFGGNGGFVEISGKRGLDFRGVADRTAHYGTAGTLLLDPNDISITSSPTSPEITFGGGCGSGTYCVNGAGASPANLLNTAVVTNLGLGPVVITTAATLFDRGEAGNLTIQANLIWNSPNELTIVADGRIEIDSGVTIQNTNGGANFDALTMSSGSGEISHLGQISTVNGNISMTGTGGVNGLFGNGIYIAGTISSTGNTASAGNITLDGTGYDSHGVILDGGEISAVSGSIEITGLAGNAPILASAGVQLTGASIEGGGAIAIEGTSPSVAGASFMTGVNLSNSSIATSGSDPLSITGIGGGQISDNSGIYLLSNSSLTASGSGPISLTGTRGNGIVSYDINCEGDITSGAGNIGLSGTAGTVYLNGSAAASSAGSITYGSPSLIQFIGATTTTTGGSIGVNGAVTQTGNNVFTTTGAPGNISFSSTIDGAGNLTCSASGVLLFSGAIGNTVRPNSLTGSGASLTQSSTVRTTGALTYTAPSGIDLADGILTVGGAIQMGGAVSLSGNTIAITSTLGAPAGANITFSQGISNTASRNLTLNGGTGGTIQLGGNVGSGTPLASLSATGALIVQSGNVNTVGAIAYTGASTLGGYLSTSGSNITFGGTVVLANTISVSTNGSLGGNISYNGSVDGAHGLFSSAGLGTIAFGADVGSATRLTVLQASGSQISVGGDIFTSQGMSFANRTVLTADAALDDSGSAGILFLEGISGNHNLSLTTTGSGALIEVMGDIDLTAPGADGGSLTVSSAGDAVFEGNIITRGGAVGSGTGKDGGAVSISAPNGTVEVVDITTSGSDAVAGAGGNGGSITLAPNPNYTTGSLGPSTEVPDGLLKLFGNLVSDKGSGTPNGIRGAVSLSSAGRGVLMSVATIVGRSFSSNSLVIIGNTILFGNREALTVFGDILMEADTQITISDLVSADGISLTAPSIVVQLRPSGQILNEFGTLYSSPSVHALALLPVSFNAASITTTGTGSAPNIGQLMNIERSSFVDALSYEGYILNFDGDTLPTPSPVPFSPSRTLSDEDLFQFNRFLVANSELADLTPLLPSLPFGAACAKRGCRGKPFWFLKTERETNRFRKWAE